MPLARSKTSTATPSPLTNPLPEPWENKFSLRFRTRFRQLLGRLYLLGFPYFKELARVQRPQEKGASTLSHPHLRPRAV